MPCRDRKLFTISALFRSRQERGPGRVNRCWIVTDAELTAQIAGIICKDRGKFKWDCHHRHTGKGGVGKTTISRLIIHSLIAKRDDPVLAIDADPNSCLDAALGCDG